jgi:hypothetical protein
MKSYGIKRMGGRRAVSQGVAVLRASLHCKVDSTGRRPKYLFSGLLVCGTCGSKYTICEGTKYGCSTWRTRGPSVCANSLTVARGLVEAELLASIQRDLFTEEGLAIFTAEVNRLIAERCRTHTPDRMRAKTELQAAEEEIENIMRAIKAGIFTPSTKAALEEAEAKRSRLLQAVNGSRAAPDDAAEHRRAIQKARGSVGDGDATARRSSARHCAGLSGWADCAATDRRRVGALSHREGIMPV